MSEYEFAAMFSKYVGLLIVACVPIWYFAEWVTKRRLAREDKIRKENLND